MQVELSNLELRYLIEALNSIDSEYGKAADNGYPLGTTAELIAKLERLQAVDVMPMPPGPSWKK